MNSSGKKWHKSMRNNCSINKIEVYASLISHTHTHTHINGTYIHKHKYILTHSKCVCSFIFVETRPTERDSTPSRRTNIHTYVQLFIHTIHKYLVRSTICTRNEHIGNDVMYMRTSGAIWMFFEFFLSRPQESEGFFDFCLIIVFFILFGII